MIIRLSKIILVAAVAFYCLLAVFGNITDSVTNFTAVERTLSMTDILPHSTIGYRAVTNPMLQHLAYVLIVGLESATALLCAVGAWKLFRARKQEAAVFNHAKKVSIAGLTLGFLVWQVFFMSIGGEWFGIWMSPILRHALAASFHIFITILVILVYVVSKDE